MKSVIFLILSLLWSLSSCYNSDLFSNADSRLSDLDYTVSIEGGTIEDSVITLLPARYEWEPYQYTLTISNPNSDPITVKDLHFERSSGSMGVDGDVWGRIEGEESKNFILTFAPQNSELFTDTLVIRSDWSDDRRYTVRAYGTEPGYYISPEGSDSSGDGSPAKPYYSINRAARSIPEYSAIRAASGEYTYSETQVITVPGIKIYGSYSTDGTWSRNEDVRDSVIYSTDNDDFVTLEFSSTQVSWDNEVSGFTIHGPSGSTGSSVAVLINGANPLLIGNYIFGSGSGSDSIAVRVEGGATPGLLFNLIYATPDDKEVSGTSTAISVVQSSGSPMILLNTIYGGGGLISSYGIYLKLDGDASADIYSNSIYSGVSRIGDTYGVYGENVAAIPSNLYIINNLIIAGKSGTSSSCVYHTQNATSIILNNIFTSAEITTPFAVGVHDTGSTNTNSIENNCFDMYALLMGYVDNMGSNYDTAATINALGNALANVTQSPVFDSYDNFKIQTSTPAAILAGGLDLAVMASSKGYYPLWIDGLQGYYDLYGALRTGNGATGYTMGSFEIDSP